MTEIPTNFNGATNDTSNSSVKKILQKQQQLVNHHTGHCNSSNCTTNNLIDTAASSTQLSQSPPLPPPPPMLSPPTSPLLANHTNDIDTSNDIAPAPTVTNIGRPESIPMVNHTDLLNYSQCPPDGHQIQTTTAAHTTITSEQTTLIQNDSTSIAERSDSLNQLKGLDKESSEYKIQRGAIIKKFQKFDLTALSSAPAPDVKIGQRVAYKEYYGNEFGTIRWIGRVPQISPDWTVGVEFDNAIGEGDGSLHGRRYFIAKDCFAKFLPLDNVALVDQHVGRPEPGTMISVMSAAVRPGQMISIQRVSTVHVQHCFLNAPHRMPGAEFLAINTRLHCQCPNCGPCAHVVKPPRTQRIRAHKNATHMCQFSTYTCCGMESSEDALCTYTGNKISSLPPPTGRSSSFGLPPIGNSWMEGSGYLSNLQAEQRKLMPEEYRLGAAPEDIGLHRTLSRHGSGKRSSGSRQRHDNETIHSSTASPRPNEQPSDRTKRRHNRHHHHHHHRHHDHDKRNHRQQQSQSYGKADPSSPVYMNLKGHEDNCNSELPSYLESLVLDMASNNSFIQTQIESTNQLASSASDGNLANPASHDDNRQFGVVSPDKPALSFERHPEQQQKVSFDAPDLSNMKMQPPSERDLNGAINGAADACASAQATPKSPKFFYRDSIENRYLFPTDDIIDSTLEADLENLSQARYGYLQNSRLNGTSRNIFKSLRSLVSCLSAKSNHSGLGSRHSENTMRFFERPTNEINKSQPIGKRIAANGFGHEKFEDGDDSCEHFYASSSSGCGRKSTQLAYDFPVVKHNSKYETEKVGFYSIAATAKASDEGGDAAVPRDFYHQKHDSNGGSSGCSRSFVGGTMGASGGEATTTTTTTTRTMEHVRRQISTSSDCGFSSASQNSINFPSYTSCSPILSADDDRRRMNQIYKRIASRLISSTASITSEDLLKLKRTLFELHSESCCLHDSIEQNMHHHKRTTTIEMSECEQVIADIIKKSYFESPETFNHCLNDGCADGGGPLLDKNPSNVTSCHPAMAHETVTCCQRSSDTANCKLNKNGDCHHSLSEEISSKNWTLNDSTSNNSRVTNRSATHCVSKSHQHPVKGCDAQQATIYDSREAPTAELSIEKSNGEVNSGALPKAFELKLTLCINSDKSPAQSPSNSNQDARLEGSITDESMNGQDKAVTSNGSKVNINIVSSAPVADKSNSNCFDSKDFTPAGPREEQHDHHTDRDGEAELSLEGDIEPVVS